MFFSQIASDDESSSTSSSSGDEEESIENSATEISTDSEFEHDGTTPTQTTQNSIRDCFVRKTRGDYVQPKKVQVKSRVIKTCTANGHSTNKYENSNNQHISVSFSFIV